MNDVAIVTLEEILYIHADWLKRLGGMPGVWNRNVLIFAYEVQQSPYYETLFAKAANFGGRITKEHAFNDGNKRTGFTCMQLFLARNGYSWDVDYMDAYPIMMRLALGTGVEGEMTYEQLAGWLRLNTIRP